MIYEVELVEKITYRFSIEASSPEEAEKLADEYDYEQEVWDTEITEITITDPDTGEEY